MKYLLQIHPNIYRFGIPLLIILSSVLLAINISIFQEDSNLLALGITLDLVLLSPFVYFLLIRKSNISKFTITPFFVLGLVLSFIFIPKENQAALNFIITYILPFIELFIASVILIQILKIRKHYQVNKKEQLNFIDTLELAVSKQFPTKVASAVAIEVGMFYYAFYKWNKPKYSANEFTYHKNSGILAILIVLLFVAFIELFALHLLLHSWSITAAWIFSGISIYGIFQIFGLIKSIPRTPIQFKENTIVFRFGIFLKTTIPYQSIQSFELTTKDLPADDKSYQKIVFNDYNMLLHLTDQGTIHGLFGIKRKYQHLAVSIDDKEKFSEVLSEKLNLDALA